MCLIQMYLYKLRHSVGLWICLLLNGLNPEFCVNAKQCILKT